MHAIQPLRIAIVGGGYSGISLAANICHLAESPVHIAIIDTASQFGQGIAYSTQNPLHLLNVRAKEMSVFHSDSKHFVKWLEMSGSGAVLPAHVRLEDQFVPRYLYAQYLQALLKNICEQFNHLVKIELITDEAMDIEDVGAVLVKLRSGKSLEVDKLVLAYGHILPEWRVKSDQSISVMNKPWHFSAYQHIAKESDVLIVGTGLTMVDAILQLHLQGHQGKINAISRHGFTPLAHEDNPPDYTLDPRIASMSLRQLCQYTRNEYDKIIATGQSPQALFRALRIEGNTIWKSLSLFEKKQFMRHLSPYWDRQRHRIAKEIAEFFDEQINQQKLIIHAGRLVEISDGKVMVKLKHANNPTVIDASYIINCTGPGRYSQASINPIVDALIAQGKAVQNDLSLGLLVTSQGAIIDKNQQPSDKIYAIGPPLKGCYFESTAVREIAIQSDELSRLLVQFAPL